MRTITPRQARAAAAAFCVAGASFLASVPAFRLGFSAEDSGHIANVASDASYVTKGLSGAWYQGETGWGAFYRPVVVALLAVEQRLWGAGPFGYHFVSILLHCANAVLVFALMWTLRRKEPDRLQFALFSGLLFAVWARHSESVAFISDQTDLLATAGALTALISFLLWIRSRRVGWVVLTIAAAVIAMLSKENMIVLPVMIVVIHWYEMRRFPVSTAFAALLLISAYATMRIILLGHFDKPYVWIAGDHAVELPAGQFSVVALFQNGVKGFLSLALPPVVFAIPPFSLIPRCFYRTYDLLGFALLGSAFVGLLLLFATGWKKSPEKSAPMLLAGLLLFSALPALPLRYPLFDITEERQLYFSSVFFIPLFVAALTSACTNARLRTIILTALVVLQVIALQWSLRQWTVASRISQNLESAAASMLRELDSERQKVVFLDIPGMYRSVILIGSPRMVLLRSGRWPLRHIAPEDVVTGLRWSLDEYPSDRRIVWSDAQGALRGRTSDGKPIILGPTWKDSTGVSIPLLYEARTTFVTFKTFDTFCNYLHREVEAAVRPDSVLPTALLTYANGSFVVLKRIPPSP